MNDKMTVRHLLEFLKSHSEEQMDYEINIREFGIMEASKLPYIKDRQVMVTYTDDEYKTLCILDEKAYQWMLDNKQINLDENNL